MAEDRILEEAIKAIENGQRARARDLLTRLLRQNQADVSYWLYMSAVVDTPKERIFCLENVLKYEPNNKTALRGLVMSGGMPFDETAKPVRPLNERKLEGAEIFSEKVDEEGDEKKKAVRKSQTTRILPVILVAVLAVALIYIGIFGSPFEGDSGFAVGRSTKLPTLAPVFTPGPTDTLGPTDTPEGGPPTPTIPLPTALEIVVEEKFTPTPRYVNTPHPNYDLFETAMDRIEEGNYSQALSLLEQVLQEISDDPEENEVDLLYYIALTKMLMGDYEEAKSDFSEIIRDNPAFVAAYLGRGRNFYEMLQNYNVDETTAATLKNSASNDLYRAMNLDPDYIEAYLWIADFRLYLGEPEEALPILENAVKRFPENAMVYYYLAETHIALQENEEALEAAQLAFQYDPTLVRNYRTLGQALVLNGQAAEAYGVLDLYLQEEGNEEDALALYLFGRAQQALDMHGAAVETFKAAYAIRKDIYEMSNYWAISLIALGEYDAALERVQVPIDRMPRWFEPYQVKAMAYFYKENYSLAKETIEEGADNAKTDDELALLYYWRAKIYGELGYPVISADNWVNLLELGSDVVPIEWLREARLATTQEPPTSTPSEPTPTRVPTPTPRP